MCGEPHVARGGPLGVQTVRDMRHAVTGYVIASRRAELGMAIIRKQHDVPAPTIEQAAMPDTPRQQKASIVRHRPAVTIERRRHTVDTARTDAVHWAQARHAV